MFNPWLCHPYPLSNGTMTRVLRLAPVGDKLPVEGNKHWDVDQVVVAVVTRARTGSKQQMVDILTWLGHESETQAGDLITQLCGEESVA